ncbi:MAG: cytochrome B6 [Bacteroidales bacterium]|nr:cytochrome B6 [Bacteroidales bacterium]
MMTAGLLLALICTNCREQPVAKIAESSAMETLLNNEDLQVFGEKLFFDTNLSSPEGQSCAACHGPEVGWTGPDETVNKTGGVYPGALHERYGNRKPNSSAYATLSPVFHSFIEEGKIVFCGGNFWDGRATGSLLGNPAADQAQGPFLNPVEQNIDNAKNLVDKVCRSEYSSMFIKAGKDIWKIPDISKSENTNLQFGIIAIAIAAFEHSGMVNQFSSKYDFYLKGKVKLTATEEQGLELFRGKAKCSNCHVMEYVPGGALPLFTDFTFDNLGIPGNPQNPWYAMDTTFNKKGENWTDPGLAEFLEQTPQYAMYAEENYGKHQVPTLRNVDKRPSPDFVKCYGHNGYFKSLEEIVHFYNTRDVLPSDKEVSDPKPGVNCWPEPEVAQNMNTAELGNLGLTAEEESAIVEFMKILSDGYTLQSNQ